MGVWPRYERLVEWVGTRKSSGVYSLQGSEILLPICSAYTKKHFHDEDSPALEQAAQCSCTVSVLADFQYLRGQSPERPGLRSWLTLLRAGGWTRDCPRALPASFLLWSSPTILYPVTGNGVCRYIRIYSMGWGWNLLPVVMLMLPWPHKSHILSELHFMQLRYGDDSCSLFPSGICKHSIKFSNYSYSKWWSMVSPRYSKCSISISPWSNTNVNFAIKHRHILGNVLLNLIKITEHQPADRIQRVLNSWSCHLSYKKYIHASLCYTVLQKWTCFMY